MQYLILQLLKENQQYQQISRLSSMIHNQLFKKLEFRIRVSPTRSNLHYHQKEVEYSSLSFDTIDELKEKAKKDLFPTNVDVRLDLIIQDRIVNDTNLNLELIYRQFYVPEREKSRLYKNVQKILTLTSQQDQQSQKQQQKIKELISQRLPMEINYSIQGVGGHENLPYLPNLVDEQQQKLEQQIIEIIEPQHFRILFTIVNNFIKEGKRFMSTIQKIVGIMRFLCNSSANIKSLIINCQGIVVLIKIYLQDPQENEKLLDFIDDLLTQTNKSRRRFSENIDPCELSFHDQENVLLLNQVIHHLEVYTEKKIQSTLCQIIPLIVRDLSEPIQAIIQYFQKNIRFEWNNEPLALFGAILQHTPTHYLKLREATQQSGIYQQAVQCYLSNKQTEEWNSTNANCLRIVLSVAIASKECQLILNEVGIISQVFQHAHNHNESMKELQRVCDSYINFVKEDNGQYIAEELKNVVQELSVQRETSFGLSCKNKRQQIMKKFQKSAYNQKIQSLQQEKGLQCMACKEGYSISPNQLGVYVYSIPYQIPEERAFLSMQTQETVGIQSVTYYTIIHLQCHRNTVECAIKAYKEEQPKSPEEIEWECAVKNNGCKCNNFLPLKNGNAYEETLDNYLRRCEKIMKNKIVSKCWILLNDLKGLILRMATSDDLSSDAGAGAQEHNLKLIPIMMSAILNFNISQYAHLMSLQQTSIEHISIAIIVALFHPYSDWQHYKVIYNKEAKEYLIKAIVIVDLIMENILKQAPNDSNYQKGLESFLNQDQINMASQFEKLSNAINKKQ